ncbi:MAG: hypothetical protein KDK70_32915 [Myxococcales bacterium]|nr:hypothetical protein [Myxococcales bacterium]
MATHAARASALALGLGLALLPAVVSASNGTKPRIPVDWTGAPCMTIVDRSASATVHFEYMVSQEDTDITVDEVDDSRRHQFFAFCKAHDPQTFLPRWITQADIDRAAMVGAAPNNVDPEDILEQATLWTDCFERINADDDRYPITFAAADAGVDWDTTLVPAGTYIIEGYTWEPAINIWSARPGVVKVVDGPDPALSPPALAINNTEEVINKNESVVIEGCVSAMDGATVTAYWGLPDAEIAWQPFIESDPVAGESFAVEFTPPEELAGESAMIRVDVTDPMGRSYTNYMHDLVIVLGTDGPGGCNDGGFIGGPGCADSGDSGDSGSDTTSSGEGTGDTASSGVGTTPGQDGGDDGSPGGCGCRSNPGGPPTGLLLLSLLALRRRRSA